jgi:hypothetical protein
MHPDFMTGYWVRAVDKRLSLVTGLVYVAPLASNQYIFTWNVRKHLTINGSSILAGFQWSGCLP